MPELVNVKLPKKSKAKLEKEHLVVGQDQWPWGLKLNFEKEQIDKLPALEGFKVNDKVTIHAQGSVVAVRVSERQGDEDQYSVEIQIEEVSVEPAVKKKLEEMTMPEYRKARMGK